MNFCQPHWDQLRLAIADRGLSHLVAKSGEAAAARLHAELDGTATDATYDPLMTANNMICVKALEVGGLYLLSGDYCPLCELVTHSNNSGLDAEWICGCTDSILAYCREHGLTKEGGA